MKFTLKGYTACKGIGEGEALVCRKPFMFLSYVDIETGFVHAKGHELEGKIVKDKIIVSPCGCGPTSEESALVLLKEAGMAPSAVVIGSAVYAPGVIGAIIADVPMVYGYDQNALQFIEAGDLVRVDAHKGIVEVTKKEI